MNNVQLLGNLARDAEVRYTKTGKAVATFTVAASNSFTGADGEVKEQTAFVCCVAWGKMGEAVGSMRKGDRIFLTGRINTRSYEAQDGSKRYVTEVIADFVGQSLQIESGTSNFEGFAASEVKDEALPF